MASGAYDKTVAVFDVRSPDNVTSFATTADMECLQWNPHNAATFAVSTEDRNVTLFDARNNKLCGGSRLMQVEKAALPLQFCGRWNDGYCVHR